MTSKAPEKDRQVEQDLLSEIISLDPRHLTLEELVVKMKADPAMRIALRSSIHWMNSGPLV
jgi:hypothetical protein